MPIELFAEPQLLGFGRAGLVYRISPDVVVKILLKPDEQESKNECLMFDRLDRNPRNPNLVLNFYRTPKLIFMQHLGGGTLDARLRQHQVRDSQNDERVIRVKQKEPLHLVLRWMAELTDAIAQLERMGYVHADIRPPNLLLDAQSHLKVIDFDSATVIGTEIEGIQPPYGRLLWSDARLDRERGTFGYYGPRTEQFAIGSVFYYMLRGYEIYENEWFSKDHGPCVVDRLKRMNFPTLHRSEMDDVITRCWHGEYSSIASLNVELNDLAKLYHADLAAPIDEEPSADRATECKRIVEDGLLDDLWERISAAN